MITCRRHFLDRMLTLACEGLGGVVLDIGGVREKTRGSFRVPQKAGLEWKIVNIDPAAKPDFLMDCCSLALPDGSFDAVVMTEVLEYVIRPDAALAEAFRVLKPGGAYFGSVPFLCPLHGDAYRDHFRMTATGLRALLAAAGFVNIRLEPMGGFFSVVCDMNHVGWGYAARPGLFRSLAWQVNHRLKPLAVWLDGHCPGSEYITTGFFINARKA